MLRANTFDQVTITRTRPWLRWCFTTRTTASLRKATNAEIRATSLINQIKNRKEKGNPRLVYVYTGIVGQFKRSKRPDLNAFEDMLRI